MGAKQNKARLLKDKKINRVVKKAIVSLFVLTGMCPLVYSQIDAEANADKRFEFDVFEDLATENEGELDGESASESKIFWDKARFTYLHELGFQEGSPDSIETNRSTLRLRWESLIRSNYFVNFDGKTRAYFNQDRQARFENDGDTQVKHSIEEFYVQASWGSTSLTLGKQKIIWGESSIAVINDVMSPRNIEDFLFTSLDESRIGQNVLKLDHFSSSGNWTLLFNPSPKKDTELLIGGSAVSVIDTDGIIISEQDESDIESEYGLHWDKTIGRGDYSLMLAEVASNQGVYYYQGLVDSVPRVNKEYPTYKILGVGLDFASSSYSFNVEAAYKKDMSFQVEGPYSAEENNGVIFLDKIETGVSIQVNRDGNESYLFGLSNQHTIGWRSDIILVEKDMNAFTFSWSDKFLHDNLSVSYVVKYELENKNLINNINMKYSLTDDLYLSLDLHSLETDNPEYFPYLVDDVAIFRFEYNF